MKSKVLNDYVDSNIFCIEWNLKIFQKEKGENAIHDLRVSIKKIRAIFSFLKKTFKEFDIPNCKDLKPLFISSGQIREIQLNIEHLSKLPDPPEKLINKLKKAEIELTTQFLIDLPHYLNSTEIFEHGLKLPNEMPSKQLVLNYFEKALDRCERKLSKKGNETDLHKLRKNIKKMMYVYMAMPKKFKKHIELNEKYIDKLQEKAGKWHDDVIAIESLKNCKELTKDHLKYLKKKERKHFLQLDNKLKKFKSNIRL